MADNSKITTLEQLKLLAQKVKSENDALADKLEGIISQVEAAGYQTSEDVQSAIASAIAGSGHAHFETADEVPDAETAEENVLYLVEAEDSGHYNIYAKVGVDVVQLGSTDVDLSEYATTDAMTSAISAAIEALNMEDYAKADTLLSATSKITELEGKLKDYYTKEQIDTKLEGYVTDEEAKQAAEKAVTDATASNEDVTKMLDEVFTPAE